MERRIEGRRVARVWLERIVWNSAAAAALALMIMVLLYSLEWLDRIDPQAAAAPAVGVDAAEVADVRRPDGAERVGSRGPSG